MSERTETGRGGLFMRTGLRELYFRRLLDYALRYRGLLLLTVTAGLLNLGLTFVFPWLIGSAIDWVIAPDWAARGLPGPPPFEQRVHWLFILIAVGAGTALMFGLITYVRGH